MNGQTEEVNASDRAIIEQYDKKLFEEIFGHVIY